mgnify:CR=1 FL=1
MLSRLENYERVDDEVWKAYLRIDIVRAYIKLNKYWKRDNWSLYHGIWGNMWIWEIANKRFQKPHNNLGIKGYENIKLLP